VEEAASRALLGIHFDLEHGDLMAEYLLGFLFNLGACHSIVG
jgi:hypothetical protein